MKLTVFARNFSPVILIWSCALLSWGSDFNHFLSPISIHSSRPSIFTEEHWIKDDTDDSFYLPLDSRTEIQEKMAQVLGQAKKRIRLLTYNLNKSSVIEVLKQKAQSGVPVQVIIGKNFKRIPKRSLEEHEALRKCGIDLVYASQFRKDSGFVETIITPDDHRKLALIDDDYAYVGSDNFTESENRAIGVVIYRRKGFPKLMNQFRQTWPNDGEDKEVSETRAEVPLETFELFDERSIENNIRLNILKGILKAKKRIFIAQFHLNDPLIVHALITRKQNDPDLDIRVLLNYFKDPPNIAKGVFPYYKNLEVFKKLKSAGIPARWFRGEALNNFDHRKLFLFDDAVNFGSGDAFPRAYFGNRELNIQIENSALAEHFGDVFKEDWDRSLEFIASRGEPGNAYEHLMSAFFNRAHILVPKTILLFKRVNYFAERVGLHYSLETKWAALIRLIQTYTDYFYIEVPDFDENPTLYHNANADVWTAYQKSGLFSPSPIILGELFKGVYTTTSLEFASKHQSAQAKGKARPGAIFEFRLQKGKKIMTWNDETEAALKEWCRSHFGLPVQPVLRTLFLLEKSYVGYFYPYAKVANVAFIDPSALSFIKVIDLSSRLHGQASEIAS